jgi:hypothetical protein
MCRTKELGGRRCPSHSKPERVSAYNAVRRSRYAANKAIPTSPSNIEHGFQPFSENRTPLNPQLDGTVPEAVERFREESKAYLDILMQHQDGLDLDNRHGSTPHAALSYYTGSGYSHFKKVLNGYDMILNGKEMPLRYDEETTASMRGGIAQMDKALSLAPKRDTPRVVYRGLRIPSSVAEEDVSSWLSQNFPENGIVSQPNFMSTTLNPRLASHEFAGPDTGTNPRAVVIEIMTKRGAPVGEGISLLGEDEHEYVIERGARFNVVSVTENVDYQTDMKDSEKSNFIRTVVRLVDAD